jgi:hypothetical protein
MAVGGILRYLLGCNARVKKHSSNKDDPHIRRLVNIASRSSFILNLSFVKGLFDHPSMIVCRKYEHICEGI